MKKKTIIIIIGIISSLILISIIIWAIISPKTYSLSGMQYDILIDANKYEYEDVDSSQIPEGGNSSKYYYNVINSRKGVRYKVVYEDIWQNTKEDVDKINITIKKVSAKDVKKALKKYKKVPLSRLKDLLDDNIKEKYIIEKIKEK